MKISKPKRKRFNQDGRLMFTLATFFFLAGSIIFKLYNLQVTENGLYTALAYDQHQVFSKLEPERGQILINDREDNQEVKLYPIALNKEFALVYAVPKVIANATATAEKLYEIFNRDEVEKQVTELIDQDPLFTAENAESESKTIMVDDRPASNLAEFKAVKTELENELRKKKIINDYILKLLKNDDPYEPIKYKVDVEKLKELMDAQLVGIDYEMQKDRFYPEPEMGGQFIGFVGYKNNIKVGQYGLEGYFNDELAGKPGSIKAERSADGELVIVNDREYKKAEDGSDLILTINRSIQYTTCTKLKEAVKRHGADGGSVIIIEPKTGAILAMCSYPDYDPNEYSNVADINIYNNPVIFKQFEPGSVFKAVTIAASMDQGKINPETTYNDKGFVQIEGWPKPIKNSDYESKGGRGIVNILTVLEQSLNTGAIFAMQRIGPNIFADYVKKFGFGEKTGIELETESPGSIKRLLVKNIRPVEAATASFGQGITVTALQMANAYAAIANNGILMKPYLIKEIDKPDGEKVITQSREIRRVISERTAALLSGMLVQVVENGHGKRAKVDGYYIGGKTGTAQVPKRGGGYEANAHIGSFAGFGPVDDPVFAMLVVLDNPRDVEWAESSAAPLFGEIAKFILDYYQVPKER